MEVEIKKTVEIKYTRVLARINGRAEFLEHRAGEWFKMTANGSECITDGPLVYALNDGLMNYGGDL